MSDHTGNGQYDGMTSPCSPRVLAISNQKGGVGKTTTAINLGAAFAATGERVLIIDLDPQGNAGSGLGMDREAGRASIHHTLMREALLEDSILESDIPLLDCAPSTMDLLGLESELASADGRTHRLAGAIDAMVTRSARTRNPRRDYAYILIDCPPSLNLLTVNALCAADAVIVPLQCEFFALEGLAQLVEMIEHVRGSLNPRLNVQGIVLTMFDRRNSLSQQVEQNVRAFFGGRVYETAIPRNIRICEAPSHGQPVLLYDDKCAGSKAYIRLTAEIIQRERGLRMASGN